MSLTISDPRTRASRRAATKGRGWAKALTLLILAIAWSPRIRVGAVGDKAADVRAQDLMVLALGFAVVAGGRWISLRHTWGRWPAQYLVVAVFATTLTLLINDSMSIVRTTVFFGRAVELFVLAGLVAALYAAAGQHAALAARRAIYVAAWGNIAWVAYQAATGTNRVLIGQDVGDLIESYGPKLIGEASSFGTGFFFAFVVAFAAANIRARQGRLLPVVTLVAAVAAAYLSQSRVSLLAIVAIVTLLALRPRGDRPPHPFGATVVAGLGAAVYLSLPEQTEGRLSGAGIEMSANQRVEDIWLPLLKIAFNNPLLGIGPGPLGTPEYPWTEAHNIALRAALDYGVIAAVLLLCAFFTIASRARRAAQDPATPRDTRMLADLAFFSLVALGLAGLVQDAFTSVTASHLTMLAVGLFAGASRDRP